MLKRKIKYALIAFAIVSGIQMTSYAAEGVITAETVKLRKEGSMQGKLITLLSADDTVEVIEKEGDWYKVKVGGETGYVYAQYVKVEEEVPIAGQNEPAKQEDPEQEQPKQEENEQQGEDNNSNQTVEKYPKEMKLLTEGEIKVLPLIQSLTIENVTKDLKVMAIEEINGWVYIATDKVSGWIRIEKLEATNVVNNSSSENQKPEETTKPETAKPDDEEPGQNEKKVKYVNVDVVNVREQENTSSEIIMGLALNTEVTVISEANNWSKVEINGKTGYIASKYLSDKKTQITNRSSEVERKVEEPEEKGEITQKEEEPQKEQVPEKKETVSTSSGGEVVAYAKSFLGVPYVSGGSTPKGFDCSGFTQYVYAHFGKTLSRTTNGQASNGVKVSKSDLQLGDIIIFRNGSNTAIGHVGIYVGGGNFIHASSPGDVVKITSLSTSYYSARYVTARRIL